MDAQYISIAVGMAFGAIQKYLLPKLPNWLIPVVNTGLGAVAGHYIPGLGIGAGAVAGLASVGGHQLVKQPLQAATGRTL